MSTLVFDIETIGEDWDSLDAVTKGVLSRWTERSGKNLAEKRAQLTDLKDSLGFSPLTGRVVAIGLYDLERSQGAVYYQSSTEEVDFETGDYVLKRRSEAEMLEDFWEGARSYDTFVTFNGRCFDVPFLLHRSVVCGVKPTVDLMEGRYLYQQKSARHVDLQDQLTFYGAMHRKPSLHLFCRAYGIESPKTDGVGGDDVAELFQAGKFREIAHYNARDVIATTALYEKWLEYLAPPSFLNMMIE
ncbi:ribonuclease H-like domain-containing protein [Candidatus Pacebacteria bacterium]|nr:ribonuclease H-like domain-containing protein [Candidatus Paceibacterota bacterium]